MTQRKRMKLAVYNIDTERETQKVSAQTLSYRPSDKLRIMSVSYYPALNEIHITVGHAI